MVYGRGVNESPQPRRSPAGLPRLGPRRRAALRREPPAPSPRPTAGRLRWTPPARREDGLPTGAWLLASALAHALLVAAVLLDFRPPPRQPEVSAASFDIVFEGGPPERPEAEPPPGLENPPEPPPMAQAPAPPPSPAAPPEPVAPPQPPTPEQAVPPPVPPLAQPPAPVPPVAAMPPPPTPPRAEPARPDPPSEQAILPPLPSIAEILPSPPALRLRERLPVPPETPPVPPQQAPQQAQPQQPRPPSRPQQAAPAFPPGTLFVPDGLQLGQPRPSQPQAGRRQAQGLDLTVDPRIAEGQARPDPNLSVTGAEVGADWRAAFRRWLDQNIRYPARAAQLGESGRVKVQVIAAPDGTVRSVRLVTPSTSPSLNFGTTFPFQGARLPPFPPPADPNGITIDLTVNYILIRR